MATTALYVLLAASAVAAVQVGFVPPSAGNYIYRSDNNGPASFIQLGAPAPYHPIAQPLKALEAYDLAPVPLPYIAAKPIIVEDAEDDDDDSDEVSDEYHGGDAGFEHGGGNGYGEEHHSAHGEKGAKGFHSKGHHAKGEAGHYGKEHKEGSFEEAEGGKKGHHDEARVHGKHYEAGETYKGGDHGHKKHHSKGEEVTGYHKVFNKDEFKKDHDFYDVADNSGHFNKHGYEKGHHSSAEGGHKEGGHHDAAFAKGDFGKAGHHGKEHFDVAHKGHSAEEGHDSDYEHGEGYGKKGESAHGKDFAYADGDDDDDDEYDDKE